VEEVTFLFTDIESSTGLLERLGADYAGVLLRHRELIEQAIEDADGVVVDCRGDEFFAAFATPRAGIDGAIAAQRAVVREPWPDGTVVRVRMGLHTGRAQRSGDGYVGLAVHHAARIAQTARGGEILVSRETLEGGGGGDAVDLGEHALRGIPRPTRLYRIRGDGLPAEFPPLPGAKPEQAPLRVALADDSVLLREGIAALLEEEGFDVVGQSGTAVELLELVDEELPDVAIVDIRMPPTKTDEGLRAARDIRRRHPETGVLLLSLYLQVEDALELFTGEARGLGYLLKDRVTDVDEFTAAVRRVAAGGTVLDVTIVDELRAGTPSERERAVLALVDA